MLDEPYEFEMTGYGIRELRVSGIPGYQGNAAARLHGSTV